MILKKLFEPIIMIMPFFKDNQVPVRHKILAILVVTAFTIPLLPLLLILIIKIMVLFFALIFMAVLFFIFAVFPLFTLFSCLTDILIGKKLRSYRDNDLCKYHLPLFTYYFSLVPIALLNGTFRDIISSHKYGIQSQLIITLMETDTIFILSSLCFLIIFYWGMWRRLNDREDEAAFFILTLKQHRKFLNLSFIPLSFIIAVIGLFSAFSDVDLRFAGMLACMEMIMSTMQMSFGAVLLMLLLLYIVSLPVQLLALFINHIVQYMAEEGHYYKKVIAKTAGWVEGLLEKLL